MAQYQAGMLVVYGKLGVHEIETVGLQSFCGKPAKITIPFALILRIPTTTAISPRQKKVLCARCPGTAGGSRFGTHLRDAIMSKKQRNFKEKQWVRMAVLWAVRVWHAFLPWGKSRSSHLMPDWIKIAVLIGQNIGFVRLRFYYTHFKLCWQSFFASIIGRTCNFEKHCLFFAYLTTKFI